MFEKSLESFIAECSKVLDIEIQELKTLPFNKLEKIDSLGKILLSTIIESFFGLEIKQDEIESKETIKDLYDFCLSQKKLKI
jgi:acyl carrier protein